MASSLGVSLTWTAHQAPLANCRVKASSSPPSHTPTSAHHTTKVTMDDGCSKLSSRCNLLDARQRGRQPYRLPPRMSDPPADFLVAHCIMQRERWGCSAYLGLACLDLFSLTKYYLFYQPNTIYAVSRTGSVRERWHVISRRSKLNAVSKHARPSPTRPVSLTDRWASPG